MRPKANQIPRKNRLVNMNCDYCSEPIFGESKTMPDDLPDDIPWSDSCDLMHYHRWCFEEVVDEERREIASKHGS